MPDAGKGGVTGGGESIVEFQRWLDTGEQRILDAIERYNEEDCVSTLRLRDWLLERRRRRSGSSTSTSRSFHYPINEKKLPRSSPMRMPRDAHVSTRLAPTGRAPSATFSTTIGARPSPSGGHTFSAGRNFSTNCSTIPRQSRT